MSARHFASLSTAMKTYVSVIVVIGLATIVSSVADIIRANNWDWTLLAALTLVSGSATVRLPSLPATISVSETFVFTSVLLFGPAAGTITVALDALIISFWAYKKNDPLYKIVFNVSALPLTIWVAAQIFFLTAGIEPLSTSDSDVSIRTLIVPLLVFTLAYFSLNSWIITLAIALEKQLPALKIWRDNFLWLSLNYFGGASVAVLLVSFTRDLEFTHLFVIVPLLVVLYFTFSTSMGRVEDANRHLSQLNSLYISTIETLAMAIDAKDQITHGHIRRVQTYAVALAKAMGVSDEKQLKAIEAAALLHDMGKLAVPEYILNKPGPLTAAEFEKMKLHAAVGADILSAIKFPYPVVPIVRHHHENWNGKGYPDGLVGSAIPIGARILSVVDCFDALTSDRPYRPRLADKEAIRILLERRGSMYDPLVVDTFIELHPTLVATALPETESALLTTITDASSTSLKSNQGDQTVRLEDIASSAGEAVTLFALAQAVSGQQSVFDIGHVTFSQLRRLVPHAFGLLFVYLEATDEVKVAYVSGDSSAVLTGMRIVVGERLTGWVAANRQTIRNSDPVLDLGEVGKTLVPRPRSCLSTPVVSEGHLAGVLTIYSAHTNFFTEEHERIIEAAARQIAAGVRRAAAQSGAHDRDRLKPSLNAIPRESLVESIPPGTCLVLFDQDPREQNRVDLSDLAARLSAMFAPTDLIFRRGDRQIAILSTDSENAVSERMTGETINSISGIRASIAVAPRDGNSVEQLLGSAERQFRDLGGGKIGSIH